MKNRTLYIRILLIFFIVCSRFSYAQETYGYKTITDIAYYDESSQSDEYIKERCKLDIYYPEKKENYVTVVWFHGGGITRGEKYIPVELKEKGFAIVAVNYRLSPRVKCPAYLDDAAAAVAWTFKNINKYGGDSTKVVVSGLSAGAYLTAMIGLDKRWLSKYGIDANNIAKLVPVSGHMITHLTVREERGIPQTQPIIDEYAPLYYVRKDTPPITLITGDRDLEMLGRYEENAYMWRMMKIAGNKHTKLYELESFNHGRIGYPAFYVLLDEIKGL